MLERTFIIYAAHFHIFDSFSETATANKYTNTCKRFSHIKKHTASGMQYIHQKYNSTRVQTELRLLEDVISF